MSKIFVKPGERVRVIAPYSEICIHMQIAGTPMFAELIKRDYETWTGYSVQFYDLTGKPYSAPVTYGEGGFYREGDEFYTYQEEGSGDADPAKVVEDMSNLIVNALDVSSKNVRTIGS